MCFGGGSKAPPVPEPVAPRPPPVQSTTQVAPAPPGTAQDLLYDEVKKKGKKLLTIPLVTGTDTGLQIN